MPKKRILISCNRTLNLGGIEKSLTTFLKAFDTKRYDVTLVLNNKNGPLFEELNLSDIHTIFVNEFDTAQLIMNDIVHFRLIRLLKSLIYRLNLRITKDWYARIMYTYRIIEPTIDIPGHFDLAYSFTSDYSDLSIVLKVDASKRACMIHGDATRNPKHARMNDPLMRQMDKIFAVSNSAKDQFLVVHPTCADKMDIFYNIIDENDILRKSKERVDDIITDGTPIICTVGRLEDVKGQHLIPKVVALLYESGYPVYWYIIGEGSHRNIVEEEIHKYHVENAVIMLGARKNPYPYMKSCDIYVQPSLSEAFCITLMEARILHKPIVVTDVPGMREQFISGENGLVVTKTSDALFKGVKDLLERPDMRKRFIDTLNEKRYTNTEEIKKVYALIESD